MTSFENADILIITLVGYKVYMSGDKMKAILITTQLKVTKVNKSFVDIQTHFPNGFVEIMISSRLPAGTVMIVQTDGSWHSSENPLGTYLFGSPGTVVYGDVFIVRQNSRGDFSGLKSDQCDKIMTLINQWIGRNS